VFDENVFPFASLHLNVGALLKKELLLLPSYSTSHESAHNCNDHIVPIVNVTNVEQEDTTAEQNSAENSEEISENCAYNDAESASETDENGAEHEEDLGEHSPGRSDPEAR
jgi:hypothetical protein